MQGKQFQWPMSSTDQQTDSPSLSTHENDDSGRDSVESRKVVSAPTRIPKVKFTCDGDGDDDLPSSPNDSAESVTNIHDTKYSNNANGLFFSF